MNPSMPQMNVGFEQTDPIICENCGGDVFVPAFLLRKVSALVSPTAKDTVLPVQLFACIKCNHVNEDMLPVEKG
tara:strand:+ start:118 stop:339 length:222 start_codon:yes stop_codon:yes gene_type:complete